MTERTFTQRVRETTMKGVQRGAIRAFTLRERFESGVSWNPTADSYLVNPYPT
jgi:hypothetical protein